MTSWHDFGFYVYFLAGINRSIDAVSVEDTSTVFHVATGVEFQALKK
jgi:hypothetical protein